jgi:NAD(P)-dependent dehydrogenase (short-subunit alcohol dehydrogenase family)
MQVIAVVINQDALQATKQSSEHPKNFHIYVVDISNEDAVNQFADEVKTQFGIVDMLCNNAGIGAHKGRIWDITSENWHQVFNVNFWGIANMIRAFVPIMFNENKKRYIVNTCSGVALGTQWEQSPYVSSKSAVLSLSELLFHELKKDESAIQVSVLVPTFVQTRDYLTVSGDAPNKDDVLQANDVVDIMLEGIENKQFYIFTHPQGLAKRVQVKIDSMINMTDPIFSEHLYYKEK